MNRFIQKIKKDSITTTVGILSAGVGNRIKSNEPRSLLKVGSKTLLEHQISVLNNVFSQPEIIVGLGVEANKIIKKLGFSESEFEDLLKYDSISHDRYRNERSLKDFIDSIKYTLRKQ